MKSKKQAIKKLKLDVTAILNLNHSFVTGGGGRKKLSDAVGTCATGKGDVCCA